MPTKLTEVELSIRSCAGGKCPTVYRSDDGRYFVQGYKVGGEIKSLAPLPTSEDLVEISQELAEALKIA